METELQRYGTEVVKAGDEASGNFKGACEAANKTTGVARFFTNDGGGYELKPGYAAKESIDGVGTKVHIYTSAFEGLVREFEKKQMSEEEVYKRSVDIWERMLSDLIAMNTDDLRQGEMAVATTNIIDINHLKGLRGKLFADTMSIAMGNVIRENDIMMTAGETAILGEPKKLQQFRDKLMAALDDERQSSGIISGSGYVGAQRVVDEVFEKIIGPIEFNIGGTSLGITNGINKITPLKSGQTVIAFQERSKDGIIGPRSNGITAIRNHMTNLTGVEWENLSFEKFLSKIGPDKAAKISQQIKDLCQGKKMWEIATGKTTVFNPFVSRTLLGGVDGEKQVNISAIIHVTGNPGKKISDGVPGVSLDLDISDMPIPTIIEILQSLCDISDIDAMKGWNMGVPYALVCDTGDVNTIIQLAEQNGIIARNIGMTGEKRDIGNTIKGVGIGRSEITLST